jgi:hypothetical protein
MYSVLTDSLGPKVLSGTTTGPETGGLHLRADRRVILAVAVARRMERKKKKRKSQDYGPASLHPS